MFPIYVTDVLEGTSDIDWLKNIIGCFKQVPGKKKSIDCHKHFLSLSLSLVFLYYVYKKSSRDISLSETDLIN